MERLWELASRVQSVAREADILGWYSKSSVAVLLLETDIEGANTFVSRIETQQFQNPVTCEIRTHTQPPFTTPPSGVVEKVLTVLPAVRDEFRRPIAQSALKRTIDVTGALMAIVLFSPLMLVAGVAVKSTSPGPVLFRRVRIGRNGRPFFFLKFRSMSADADEGVHRAHVEKLMKADPQDNKDRSGKA